MNLLHIVLLFSMPGLPEILLILFAILLLFGGKKIPELLKGIGKGISEFKKARSSVEDEFKNLK